MDNVNRAESGRDADGRPAAKLRRVYVTLRVVPDVTISAKLSPVAEDRKTAPPPTSISTEVDPKSNWPVDPFQWPVIKAGAAVGTEGTAVFGVRDLKKLDVLRKYAKGFVVCVDADFESLELDERQVKSMTQQLAYSYSSCRRGNALLLVAGVRENGKIAAGLETLTFRNWIAAVTHLTLGEMLRLSPDEMATHLGRSGGPKHTEPLKWIYLAADAEKELEDAEVGPNTVLIVGGLVDRNKHKGFCYSRARGLGLATRKLPLRSAQGAEAGVQVLGTTVFTTNHVVEILVQKFNMGKSWPQAITDALPSRKKEASPSNALTSSGTGATLNILA